MEKSLNRRCNMAMLIIPFVQMRTKADSPWDKDEIMAGFVHIHNSDSLSIETWGGETRSTLTFGSGGVVEVIQRAGDNIKTQTHKAHLYLLEQWIEAHAENARAKVLDKSVFLARLHGAFDVPRFVR